VGYLRDVRRLTVALSRARLGLYILGRREVFESCFELKQAFDVLLQRPDKLTLVTGELWPSARILAAEQKKESVPGESVMEGVEHLGQYVYEMTNAKVAQLKAERGLGANTPLPVVAEATEEMVYDEEDEDEEEEELDGQQVSEGSEAEE